MESCEVIDRELLDALLSRNFRCLRNYGDRWGIAHVSFDGVSIGEIFDTDLNRLCNAWIDLDQAIEIQRSEAEQCEMSQT